MASILFYQGGLIMVQRTNNVSYNKPVTSIKKSDVANKATTKKTTSNASTPNINATVTSDTLETKDSATYEPSQEEPTATSKYTPDMDKVRAMKAETDARMVELFKDTARDTGLKQLGGLRGILDTLANNESVTLEIEYTAEDVAQAKKDVAPDGYWGAEKTSERLLDFAKALSGGDPSKATLLKDAFKKGFDEIKDMFGDKLPKLCEETYDLTLKKFDDWEKVEE